MDIIGLTLAGFALILVDLLLIPGSVLVAVGSGLVLYSVYLNFDRNGVGWALLHLAVCLAIAPKLIMWSFKRYSLKGEMGKNEGYVGVDDHKTLIGKRARAATDLRPSGMIDVVVDGEEQRLDCIAEGGFIERGSEVEVTEERGPSLVVRLPPKTAAEDSQSEPPASA